MKEFIEKLIGRLEGYSNYAFNIPPQMAVESCINIVNELAEEYNNDFCEWFRYDYRTIAPKNHDAENPYWRIPDNMDKLKYCPYCGKKIRVASYQQKGE